MCEPLGVFITGDSVNRAAYPGAKGKQLTYREEGRRVEDSAIERRDAALELIWNYAGIDGGHHKEWLIDQIARVLLGPEYDEWIELWKAGEDGPDSYEWPEGIAP